MALQNSLTLESGLELEEAYFKIDRFNGNRHAVSITIAVYLNGQARVDEKQPISSFEFVMDTPTENMFAEVYSHMKTLPGFAEAVDV